MIGVLYMPNVAFDRGFVPNHGMLAEVAELAVALLQVLPLALDRLSIKSTLPLLPAPGLLNRKYLATPFTNTPVPLV